MPHRNAPLTETGRLRLARCVVDDGWPLRRAAERFQVSPTTAQRWASRYRRDGEAGMSDHSSRPHHSPRRTPSRTERRIIKVRVLRRWGPARIAHLLHLNPSTVHRVLTRYGLAATHLDRATGRVIRRYERDRPGELVHVDIKKLGNIPDGGGHKILGRPAGRKNRSAAGYSLPPHRRRRPLPPGLQRDPPRRASSRPPPASGPAHSTFFTTGRDHRGTRPDRQRLLLPLPPLARHPDRGRDHPQTHPPLPARRPTARSNASTAPCSTNGPTPSPTAQNTNDAQAFPQWLHTYNHHRGHTALGGQPPATRVPNLTGQYS